MKTSLLIHHFVSRQRAAFLVLSLAVLCTGCHYTPTVYPPPKNPAPPSLNLSLAHFIYIDPTTKQQIEIINDANPTNPFSQQQIAAITHQLNSLPPSQFTGLQALNGSDYITEVAYNVYNNHLTAAQRQSWADLVHKYTISTDPQAAFFLQYRAYITYTLTPVGLWQDIKDARKGDSANLQFDLFMASQFVDPKAGTILLYDASGNPYDTTLYPTTLGYSLTATTLNIQGYWPFTLSNGNIVAINYIPIPPVPIPAVFLANAQQTPAGEQALQTQPDALSGAKVISPNSKGTLFLSPNAPSQYAPIILGRTESAVMIEIKNGTKDSKTLIQNDGALPHGFVIAPAPQ